MYHPPFQADIYYFDNLDKAFDAYSSFEKQLLIRGFRMEISELPIDSVMYEHELHNLVKEKTCFKGVHNPKIMLCIFRIQQQFLRVYQVFIYWF